MTAQYHPKYVSSLIIFIVKVSIGIVEVPAKSSFQVVGWFGQCRFKHVVCFYLGLLLMLENNTGKIFLGGVSLQRRTFAFDDQDSIVPIRHESELLLLNASDMEPNKDKCHWSPIHLLTSFD